MKILFINISDTRGGSAKAAYRLAKGIEKEYGTENLILVRDKYSEDKNVLQTRKNSFEIGTERIINIIFNVLGLQYFWLPFSPKYIREKVKEFKPDIISLHNTIGGYFKIKDLIELSRIAPIVWTLHDMWPFTANAAYTFGNEKWKELRTFKGENKIFPWIGLPTGNFLIKRKFNIYSQSNITLVAPSKWIYSLASQSPLFFNKRIEMIYHGIDTETFKPRDTTLLRKTMGILPGQFVILLMAEKIEKNSFKGGEELIKILNQLESQLTEQIVLLIPSKNNINRFINTSKIRVIDLQYIDSDKILSEYYSLADLLIHPARAESFGLVILEAAACGTPAVAFNIGPLSETISNNVDGFLIEPFDINKFVNSVLSLINNKVKIKEISQNCRAKVKHQFNLNFFISNYFNLYNEVLNHPLNRKK